MLGKKSQGGSEGGKWEEGGGGGEGRGVVCICCVYDLLCIDRLSAINLLPAKNRPRTVFGLLKIFPGQVLASAHFVLECWDKLAAGKCPGMNNFWSYGINICCKFQVCPRADTFE